MSVDPEKLASAVFLKEPIWNSRHAGYKSRTIIRQCWSDLSKEMIIDEKRVLYSPSVSLFLFNLCTHKCSLNISTFAFIEAELSDKSILCKLFELNEVILASGN
ncbi:hypothetical protein QTP88_017898 [Uroleucon formosanum]